MDTKRPNTDRIRKQYKELTFLKPEDNLAMGNLSRLIRDAGGIIGAADTGLTEYSQAYIGKGGPSTEKERALFEDVKARMMQVLRTELLEQNDEEWLTWFEAR